jgi:ubiquinone/menaquinone biosynthesis C-methylase UbiE
MPSLEIDVIKQRIRAHWSRRAGTFDDTAHHAIHTADQHAAWLALLRNVMGEGPLKVLDVGCGTGFLALLMAELGHTCTGIDFSDAMLDEARRKAKERGLAVEFGIGDAESPAVELGPVDVICMRHVIWTLPHPVKAARNWFSLLAPGGRILLVEGKFASQAPKDEYVEIAASLPFMGGQSAEQVGEVMEEAGFSAVGWRPLMDETLWLDPPKFPRYLVFATRPAE